MATDFNGIVSSGGFKPSTKNTPIDIRTRIESLSEIAIIPNPFVGMIFYVLDEEKFYVVKSLKAKDLGAMLIPDASIDEFEPLMANINLDGLATEEFVKELITQIELVPGPQGPQGTQGEQGLPGKDGENGKDGVDGKDGKDFTYDMFTPEQLESLRGPQGIQGPEGPAGKDGKDAEPVDLTGLATEEFVKEQIANAQINGGDCDCAIDLSEFARKEFVKEAIANIEHPQQDISHLATKEEVEKLHQRKYEVSGVPEGTLVKYFDNEVRVMCPKDAEFHKQNVGAGGLSNRYYMNFTMFAPEGAVTFREGTQGMTAAELVLEDELRTVVDGKRTIWLSLAVLDEATGEWTYRGDESTVDRCIGWNVLVEWYDAEGKVIIRDSFRVNIANEKCFDSVVPLYREGLANKEFVKEQIAAIELSQQDLSHLATKEEVKKLHEDKYVIKGLPEGSLVDHREKEIRIMVPADAEFVQQEVGEGGNANMYYMSLTSKAPEGAVRLIESDGNKTEEINLDGKNSKTIWLALAMKSGNAWTYFGKTSTVEKFIGWTYTLKWIDEAGAIIESDRFRINLSNESCHDDLMPYLGAPIASKTFVKEQIENVELKEGPAGQDGISVVNVIIENNHLKVELSDGQILDAGELPAGQGGGGAVNPELEKELAETKQQLLDLTYGVEYEYIYFDVQDAAAETDLKFDPVTAPKFFEEYNAAIDAGQDEDFIMSMYEQDIYRMYVLRAAADHRTMNRYEMIPIEDSEVQPKNDYISSWNAVKNVSSWNWTGDTDGGFTINQGPTSAMVFAFMKVKEEYRGKF